MEMAPKSTEVDELKKLMVNKDFKKKKENNLVASVYSFYQQFDLCLVMEKNPWKSEDFESLEKSTEDPRLEGHKTQMWGSETSQNAITNANVISLVGSKQVEKW